MATVDREFTIYFLAIYFGLLTRGPDLDSAVFVGSADEPVDADHHDDHEHAHQHHVQQVHLPTRALKKVHPKVRNHGEGSY